MRIDRRILIGIAGAVLLSGPFAAGAQLQPSSRPGPGPTRPPPRRSVPEFDPSAAGAVVALLAGGGYLAIRRRGKGKK